MERKETLEPRGLQEALEKALEAVQGSQMVKQILQLVLNYIIAELQAVAEGLE